MKSLKFNAFLNIVRSILGYIFPLITFPYSSRILQPQGLGKVNFAFSIVSYFTMIGGLGITTYATREAAKRRDDKQSLNQLSREILTINLASTIVAYILLAVTLLFVTKLYEYRPLLIVCSSSILFTTLGMEWLYSANEEYTYITVRSIIFQIISLILLFSIVRKNTDYIQYAIVCISASVGSNILNFFNSRKFISFKGTTRGNLKQHLKPIFILFAYSLAASVFTILDTSMLGFITDDIQVGYYSVSTKLVRLIRDMFPAVFSVFFARIVYYYSHNEIEEFNKLSRKTLLFILCFALPLTAGLCIEAKPLILLFCGEKYLEAIPTIQILSPLILFSGISGFLGGQILISLGKEKLYLITIIIAALIDIVLNFICIPRYGAFGAATATMISEGLILIIYLFMLQKFLKELRLVKSFIQFLFASSFMGIVVYFVNRYFGTNILSKLIIPTISGIFAYALVLYILRNDFFFEIVKTLKETIQKRIVRK